MAVAVRGAREPVRSSGRTDRCYRRPKISLAKAERPLANLMSKVLRGHVGRLSTYVLIDCAPSVSIIGHNALAYASELIVPACVRLPIAGRRETSACAPSIT